MWDMSGFPVIIIIPCKLKTREEKILEEAFKPVRKCKDITNKNS